MSDVVINRIFVKGLGSSICIVSADTERCISCACPKTKLSNRSLTAHRYNTHSCRQDFIIRLKDVLAFRKIPEKRGYKMDRRLAKPSKHCDKDKKKIMVRACQSANQRDSFANDGSQGGRNSL